jgi:hypothetical protein
VVEGSGDGMGCASEDYAAIVPPLNLHLAEDSELPKRPHPLQGSDLLDLPVFSLWKYQGFTDGKSRQGPIVWRDGIWIMLP